MRAIKLAAAALVLSGVTVPVQAQDTLVFDNWGSCNSYLNKMRRASSRSSNLPEAALWESAYCQAVAFKRIIVVFA